MTIVRWEPFGNLAGIEERMNRLFDESFRGRGRDKGADDSALAGAWVPAVDIYEQENHIVLKAELPGLDPKDVDICLENNVLTLRGEREIDNEIKRESYHRVERAYGSFARSFTLPSVVDQERIQADYKDGVLRVTLPKREEAQPKQISISVGK
jgi:HSP20 family protein